MPWRFWECLCLSDTLPFDSRPKAFVQSVEGNLMEEYLIKFRNIFLSGNNGKSLGVPDGTLICTWACNMEINCF